MTVITRFAPSPTGFLHIGGARTALFNWLYAKHHHGKFLLRIEDTDRARSTEAAIAAIHEGMEWLGLKPDEEAFYQFARAERHAAVAKELLEAGKAYYCYTQPEELAAMREKARAEKTSFLFQSPWRDADLKDAPADINPVIRLKAPREGEVVIDDKVQGEVKIACKEIEDTILLRSDGTPTYMLAVVVDDHEMDVSHVIRGDDHLNNTARQQLIYQAMGWQVPTFAHIPLIHGPDGAKLSKRHGALGVDAYRDRGYLPEAMRNYLLRLGWSHGDDEMISTEQAVEWFDLEGIGKSPSRFDFAKLENLNGHYIRQTAEDKLAALTVPLLEEKLAKKLSADEIIRLEKALPGLKERANTLVALAENARFYFEPVAPVDEKAQNQLEGGKTLLVAFLPVLEGVTEADWHHEHLFPFAKQWAEDNGTKIGKLMAPFRVAITGTTAAPSMFEVMEVLGKQESLERLRAAL
jgi:glutamyl-tRNA synthetase